MARHRDNTRGKTDALKDETELVRSTSGNSQNYSKPNSILRGRILSRIFDGTPMKLRDLIEVISAERGYKKDVVVKELMALEDEGVVLLSEVETSPSFIKYMSSPDSGWFSGSLVTIAVTLALIFFPQFFYLSYFSEPVQFLRYFFGGVLVLFLPGYSLMEALYAIKSPFDDLTRYTLSFVMSFALVILISLVLGASPIGLETLPIALSLAVFTLIMLSISIKRKYDYYQISHHFD